MNHQVKPRLKWNDIRRGGPVLLAVFVSALFLSPSISGAGSSVGGFVGNGCQAYGLNPSEGELQVSANLSESCCDLFSSRVPVGVVFRGPRCAEAASYPGPFTNVPGPEAGSHGWGGLNVLPSDTAAGTGGGDAGAALAHTGSESAMIGYVGAGLVAFGAVALGARRKLS